MIVRYQPIPGQDGVLQPAQEVQDILFVEFWEPIELSNHLIGFRREIALVTQAFVGLYRFYQVLRAPIV